MPYSEKLARKLARLSEIGRRCDGNNRHCHHEAVEEYQIVRLDSEGYEIPNAKLETKKSCSRHRVQFFQSGLWDVVTERRIVDRPRRTNAA